MRPFLVTFDLAATIGASYNFTNWGTDTVARKFPLGYAAPRRDLIRGGGGDETGL